MRASDMDDQADATENAGYFDIEIEGAPAEFREQDEVDGEPSGEEVTRHFGLAEDEWTSYRQAVSFLLKNGLVYQDENPDIFKSISQNRELASQLFSQLFLNLEYDVLGSFYILLQEDTEIPHTELIQRRAMTLQDSVILVFLRKYYLDQDIAGVTHPKIDIDTLLAGVQALLPKTNSRTTDIRRVKAAMQGFIAKKFVRKVRGDENSFLITPVLRYVVNADEMEHIISELDKLAEVHGIDLDIVADAEGGADE